MRDERIRALDEEWYRLQDEAEYPVGDEPDDIPDTVNPVSGEVE